MNEWISVKDELPPRDTPIILNVHYETGIDFVTQGEMTIWKDGTAVFYPEDYDPSGGDEYRVTHWMFLPEPPNRK